MSMRKQVYEWNCGRFTAPAGALPVGVNNNIAGQPFSIFYGGFGNNIPTPAHTEPHQFVVIEKYGVTPTAMVGNIPANTYRGLSNSGLGVTIAGPRAYLQVRINTTDYFMEPDDVTRAGLPGTAIPYPRTTWFDTCWDLDDIESIYVLPGQTWDILLTYYNSRGFINGLAAIGFARPAELLAFIEYTVYEGPDSIIALRLVEEGIEVTPANVDWFRKNLIMSTGPEKPPDS